MSIYFKVNDIFYAAVDEANHRIKFGNSNLIAMPCVDVEIKDHNNIYIHNICHNSIGTVFMLNSAIGFILQLYPDCKTIELSDTSGFLDRVTERKTNLGDRDMFLYKQTWYQRKLPFCNLKPKDKLAKEKITLLLKHLETKPSKQACLFIGLDPTSPTLFEAIAQIENDVYGVIEKAKYFYDIASIYTMPFIGKIRIDAIANSDVANVKYKQIKTPRTRTRPGVQWNKLGKHEHFKHFTWIE